MRQCSMSNCNKNVKARGLCTAHYEINRRWGNLDSFPSKHGMKGGWKLPEYKVHYSMLQRCYNPNSKYYYNYGGRGILVCDRWRGVEGFRNFMNDMGSRPTSTHSLDREDNEKGYSPDNCRWVIRRIQNLNRRNRARYQNIEFEKRKTNFPWSVRIMKDKKLIYRSFLTLEEAVKFRDCINKQHGIVIDS